MFPPWNVLNFFDLQKPQTIWMKHLTYATEPSPLQAF